jgi:hypothetical protein
VKLFCLCLLFLRDFIDTYLSFKMFSKFVVVLIGLFAALTAAHEAPVDVNALAAPLSRQTVHRLNIATMKNAVKNLFEAKDETAETSSTLRGPAMEVESTSAVKYLNLIGFSDDACSDPMSSMYLPLDSCLPNAWGTTEGNFVKWHCDSSTWKCWIRGYTKSNCKTPTSRRVAMGTLPSSCTTDLGFSSAYYSFSATMPYHTSGLMTKVYRAKDCTGTHITYYTPNSVCFDVETDDTADTASLSFNCETGVMNYWPYNYSCTGYSTYISLQAAVSNYDTCTRYTEDFDDFSVAGGSEKDVCGGLIV